MSTIAESFRRCLHKLNEVAVSDTITRLQDDVPAHSWTDELGRFRVWAANVGAHQTGLSSLDYRLRDASHIRDQVIRLLAALEESLSDIESLATGGGEDADADEPFDEEMEDFYRKFCSEFEDESESTTENQEIYQSVTNRISNLFQLSMIIRNPTDHDRLTGTDRVDVEPFKFWAQQHVSHKYPQLEFSIADRISTAMAKQRATLKYRERHHAKLSQGLDSHEEDATTKLSETIATSFKAASTERENEDTMSNAGASETSYTRTIFEGEDGMTIPQPPKESSGQKPFECPYCFFIITVKDNQDWARHIFRDLMPYVCLFPDCSTASKLYGSRRQWYRHINEKHGVRDVTSTHYQCPICKESDLVAITFNQHVGRHLEDLALFVLPRPADDDDNLRESSDGAGNSNTQLQSQYTQDQLPGEKDLSSDIMGMALSDKGSALETLSNPSIGDLILNDDEVLETPEHEKHDPMPQPPLTTGKHKQIADEPTNGVAVTAGDIARSSGHENHGSSEHFQFTCRWKGCKEGKLFTDFEDIIQHMKAFHIKVDQNSLLRCGWDGCSNTYRRREDMVRHIRFDHLLPNKFPCVVCDRRFFRQDNLVAHIRRVHGERTTREKYDALLRK